MRSPSPLGVAWKCRGTRARSARLLEPGQEMSEFRLLGAEILDVAGVGRDLERRARHHLDAVALEPSDLLRIVGEEAHVADAEIAEDLRTDAVVAQVLPEPELEVGLHGVEPSVLQRVGADLVGEPDATALLMQIDEHAAARDRDRLERLAELVAAIAPLGTEHVAGEAFGVESDEHL